jgi:hypothetical protein
MLRIESADLIQSIQNKELIKCTAVRKKVFNMSPKGVGPAVTLSKVKRNQTNRAKVLRHIQQHNIPVYKHKSGFIFDKIRVYSYPYQFPELN